VIHETTIHVTIAGKPATLTIGVTREGGYVDTLVCGESTDITLSCPDDELVHSSNE
jgi:hypothetical protein